MQIARNIWAVGSVFVTQDSKATGVRVNVSFYWFLLAINGKYLVLKCPSKVHSSDVSV